MRAIFELYLDHQSLIATIKELDARGWTNKRWTTKKGRESGGSAVQQAQPPQPADQRPLHRQGHLQGRDPRRRAPGDRGRGDVPARAGQILKRNGRTGGSARPQPLRGAPQGPDPLRALRLRHGADAHDQERDRRYRYYVCANAQKRGWHTCPSKSIPAGEIEKFVVDQVRGIGRDPALLAETLGGARAEAKARIKELEAEKSGLERELERHNAEMREAGRPDRLRRHGHRPHGRPAGSHPGRRAAPHPGARGTDRPGAGAGRRERGRPGAGRLRSRSGRRSRRGSRRGCCAS